MGEDRSCRLCLGVGILKHILFGCITSLTQGHCTWRHNQVLRSFACLFEKNELRLTLYWLVTGTVGKVETSHMQTVLANGPMCRIGDRWLMSSDPQCIAVTAMRSHMVLYSECLLY